jgi:SAM-dependent methyltransferase
MVEKPFEARAYEVPELWQEGALGEDDQRRVEDIARSIPDDVSTLADVGCGNGLFLNHIVDAYPGRFERLVGVDRSQAALAHVRAETMTASIDELPFADGELDAVTCLQVIEHLPLEVYDRGLAELARVARRYVILGVPYDENIRDQLSECPSCCTQFNANFHMRSYGDADMASLLARHGFRCVRTWKLGPAENLARPIVNAWLKIGKLRQLYKRPEPSLFPAYAICPMCGYNDFSRMKEQPKGVPEGPRPVWRTVVRRLLPKEKQYRWIAALYERA